MQRDRGGRFLSSAPSAFLARIFHLLRRFLLFFLVLLLFFLFLLQFAELEPFLWIVSGGSGFLLRRRHCFHGARSSQFFGWNRSAFTGPFQHGRCVHAENPPVSSGELSH